MAAKIPIYEVVYQVMCDLANYFLDADMCISICLLDP